MFGLVPVQPETAAYKRIYQRLLREIQAHCKAGDLLPSESELAKRYGVNRHTIRRASEELARAGIVIKKRGYGTEVLDPTITYPLQRAMRFTATLESLDLSVVTQLLGKGLMVATGTIADRLGIDAGSPVVRLQTLRIVEQWPFLVSDLYLSADLYPAFAEDFEGGSTYTFMREHYGFQPIRRRSLVNAIAASPEDARTLRIPPQSPLLRVRAVDIHPITQLPVTYAEVRFRSDRVQLEITV
ncbi:MAG: phosphonate metabolism transcriptional regulator PhnF [Planctomycetota bacterium]